MPKALPVPYLQLDSKVVDPDGGSTGSPRTEEFPIPVRPAERIPDPVRPERVEGPSTRSNQSLKRIRRRSTLVVAIAALLLLLGWQLIALGPVSAAGGIHVVDSDVVVTFPGEVDLTLTAEGDEEIVEVRVFYRPAGSNIWAYAYADFEPDTKITARQVLPPNSVTYLAPGAEVEYYYEIRDAQGNLFKSERASVEYLDHRFDWERTQIGPLTLLYYDHSESRVASVAREVQQDLDRVLRVLQLDPSESMKGVIYNQSSDAQEAFPEQSRTTTERGIFGGFAFPEQGVFVGQGLDRRIIAHESAHLLFKQALGDRSPDLPAWLDEGVASYFEPGGGARSGRTLASRSLPLRAMTSVSGTPRNIGIFYEKAESVVTFLIDEYGEDKFRQFVDQLASGQQVETSMLTTYGFDTDGLDDRWAGVETTPGGTVSSPSRAPARSPESPDNAAPFVFFSSWLIIGASLVVIAALVVRAINRKLRPARDLEEYPEYDDYPY